MTTAQRIAHGLTNRRLAVDVVAVVVLAPLVSIISLDFAGATSSRWVPVWAAAVVLPLAVRRRLPVASAIAVFAVGALQVLVGPPLLFPANLAVLVSIYTVTVYGPRWAGRTAMMSVVGGALVFVTRTLVQFGTETALASLAFAGMIVVSGLAAWALALLRRARLDMVEALRDRATRLERERDQQAQIAAAAERSRIAREMHDVVAHSLAIVVAQADGGRYAAREDPAVAVPVLTTISETGRAALADVRRILGVLRDDRDGEGDTASTPSSGVAPTDLPPVAAAPRAPQPGQQDVEALLDGVRRAGVEVSFEDVGTPVPLTVALELTVHRLLQEALTNVLKHAGPDPSVAIVRRWSADVLVIEVIDDGRGAASDAPSPGSGLGLLGMRERVGLFDGDLHAGPRHGGGWCVRAELPLTKAAPTPAPHGEQP